MKRQLQVDDEESSSRKLPVKGSHLPVDDQLAALQARFSRPQSACDPVVSPQVPEVCGPESDSMPTLPPAAEQIESLRGELARKEQILKEVVVEYAALSQEHKRIEATLLQEQTQVQELRREHDAAASTTEELDKVLRDAREEHFEMVGGFRIMVMPRPAEDSSTMLLGCTDDKVTIQTDAGPRSYECDHVTTSESQSGTRACSLCSCCRLPPLPPLTSPPSSSVKVFPATATQEEKFKQFEAAVDGTMNSKKSCCLAYGQTGSGKSHAFGTDEAKTGLIPRSMRRLLDQVTQANQMGANLTLAVGFLEVDGTDLIDLGVPPRAKAPSAKLILDEKSGVVYNMRMVEVGDIERDFDPAFASSIRRRKVRGTKLNNESSRTHYLMRAQVTGTTRAGDPIEGQLDLVDLAGNENTKQSGVGDATRDARGEYVVTDASREAMREANKINLSLSAVMGCVNWARKSEKLLVPMLGAETGNSGTLLSAALLPCPSSPVLGSSRNGKAAAKKRGADPRSVHLPPKPNYRDSKITLILQSALSGKGKTVLVAMVRLESTHRKPTRETLRFVTGAHN